MQNRYTFLICLKTNIKCEIRTFLIYCILNDHCCYRNVKKLSRVRENSKHEIDATQLILFNIEMKRRGKGAVSFASNIILYSLKCCFIHND